MEEFLNIVEELSSTEVANDPDIFKFLMFNSKFKVWDYAKILAGEFQKLSCDDRSSILRKYYVDTPAKYLVVGSWKEWLF